MVVGVSPVTGRLTVDKDLKYSGVLFMNEEEMEREIDRRHLQ